MLIKKKQVTYENINPYYKKGRLNGFKIKVLKKGTKKRPRKNQKTSELKKMNKKKNNT